MKMLNGILRLEDFNLGNVKIKNEEEVTIKVKDLKTLLDKNYKTFLKYVELKEELEEIIYALEMEKRAIEVEKGNYELHSLEEMKAMLMEMKKNG
jgi:hypothetical protein